mgnify:CR=1 FL=1|jgi:hypothetical protein
MIINSLTLKLPKCSADASGCGTFAPRCSANGVNLRDVRRHVHIEVIWKVIHSQNCLI